MKRDWDLIRKILTDIEGEKDVFDSLKEDPEQGDLSHDEYEKLLQVHRCKESVMLGHIELLADSEYIEGVDVVRSTSGIVGYRMTSDPRLTMSGHDLLDTMRSPKVWGLIKSTALSKGIDLTFDSIKVLAVPVLKSIIGE